MISIINLGRKVTNGKGKSLNPVDKLKGSKFFLKEQ